MRVIYLHGFASSPQSRKAQFFRERFATRRLELEIPTLDEGDFENLTISGQLALLEREAKGEPVALMGSSMGGYLAALYAARHPEVTKLVLLAPALRFPTRWRERYTDGELAEWRRAGRKEFFHYGAKEQRFLSAKLIDDAPRFEDAPEVKQPVLLFHGERDDVVPLGDAIDYAASHGNVRLQILQSDHELGDVLPYMWQQTEAFLFR
ncbi:MAG: alpha/beta fold hydrolase [Bryobacteraceae bacterium]|nr:alpha/beta fold hydrolase [Bryobacteraceae bacterium]